MAHCPAQKCLCIANNDYFGQADWIIRAPKGERPMKRGKLAAVQSSRELALVAGLLLGLHGSGPAAQGYPTKPVRVVNVAAGSLTDSVTRLVFARVSETLGQPFIVDSRPGAGGNIAAAFVTKAPADGYTLFLTTLNVMVINPYLYTNPGFDPLRDFEAVSMVAKISEVLIAHPSLGVKTITDFVRLAKGRPGQISYASGGNGSLIQLFMELFQRKAGIKLTHVPYKGVPPAVLAVVGGEASVTNVGLGLARPHVVSGKLVALAKTGYLAADTLPGIPALTATYPNTEFVPWMAAFAPKGVPGEVVTKLNAAVGRALAAPEVVSKLKELDVTPVSSSPGELDKAMRADMAVNRELVKSLGLKLD
jgi:tripartite-type tricarboxylate transporter receptor subunit TctC